MCGIAGIWRAEGASASDEGLVRSMLAALERRGPDGEGLARAGELTLGHRRLSILDLSEAGRQPMESAGGRFAIAFNGEIYNFEELREELGVPRDRLRSGTDTEVLLLAFERWGEAVLERLVGQFAFAVHDRVEGRLWLARDRFGEKPLFYCESGGSLAFASSIAALLRLPWVPRRLSPEALAEYATLRYVVAPRTVVEGVKKLLPGGLLRVDAGGARVSRWYRPRFEPRAGRPRTELVEEFGALLVQASRRCLVSDVPVALLLSDGIDSNAIDAAVALAGREIPAFTFRTDDGHQNTPIRSGGRGGRATDVVVSPSERFEHILPVFASFTEPVGDGASLATWMLIRRAREDATVFLCGQGADELLGGYRLSQDRFRLAALARLARLPGRMLDPTFERFLYGDEPLDARRRRLRSARPSEVPAAARYLIHRPLPLAEVASLFAPLPVPAAPLAVVDAFYRECEDASSDVDRMQEVLIRTFLTENILSFADSVAMDSSAELRMPFLDRDLAAFSLSLPVEARVGRRPGRANTKQVLRWWGRPQLEPAVLKRKKRTFHYGHLRDLLASDGDALRGLILGSRAVNEALPGLAAWVAHPPEYFRGSWEGTLWAMLTLGIWCKAVGIDGPAPEGHGARPAAGPRPVERSRKR